MTQSDMQLLVPQKLQQIEREYSIRILYAAESGSRAWGTSSEQSDFDVRFIYIRSQKDYLQLEQKRDVLEFPIRDGWDMCGWDLAKLLRLLHNSNSQIYEWLHSPIVYVDAGFSERIRPILDTYFSARTTANHYLHQANLKGKKRKRSDLPKVKYYLYSLQHLAAAQWVLDHQSPVPVNFQLLMNLLPEDIRQNADFLLLQKTAHPDSPFITHNAVLEDWLSQEQERIREEIERLPKEPEKEWEPLNRFFLAELTLTHDS